MSNLYRMISALAVMAGAGLGATQCDMAEYKEQSGLKAENTAQGVRVNWEGASRAQLRAVFGIDAGRPMVRELAVEAPGRGWAVVGRNLAPEFSVTTGKRRMSEQQMEPLRALKVNITPEIIEREQWNAFWDAPLAVPGLPRGAVDLPRKPEEIRRASASYDATGCKVKTDGARLEVSFPGLSLGIFSGRLQFTVYRGTNLLRQEAIAKTDENRIAYKYNAGLKGFRIDDQPRVMWRDTSRGWQKYEFGGSVNEGPVALRARNRLVIVEAKQGSLAVFPPPHKFFWAREIELNLGYVYYRKDDASTYGVGVRNAEREEGYRPLGVSNEEWQRRVSEARRFSEGNFALYNAPPGTWQRMAVYYYLSPESAEGTQKTVMEFTHDDTYKAIPGHKVVVSHFHTHFNEVVSDAGTLDYQPTWIPTFRALGINVAMMSDFHGDGHANDPGPLRFQDQKVYFDACRRHSDRDFLLMPGEEPNVTFGGHYTMVFPRPVYWSHKKEGGQQFQEQDAKYGRVYHVGSEADEVRMLEQEGGFVWQSHPRTKGSTGYPEAARESLHFRSDRFLGGSYQSLPVDLSEQRICEKRCFSTLDDMNNWSGPKYLVAEGDTYAKHPDDETYPHLMVNYVKADRVPGFDEDWTPILKAMRAGDYFVTSGEIVIPKWSVDGSGAKRTVTAEVQWTFPLEFVEVVWGDGNTVDRKIVRTSEMPAFGSHKFSIPFDAAGKKWVRFAAWDSAGDGGFTQPAHLK